MQFGKPHNLSSPRGIVSLLVLLLAAAGCTSMRSQVAWRPTSFAVPDDVGLSNWSLAAAEELYATAVDLEARGCSDCLEGYYHTATSVWPVLQRELSENGKTKPRTADLYRSSVGKLLVAAQKFGCWKPGRGLVIPTSSGPHPLAATFRGFVWGPEEFHHLEPVGDYETPKLSRAFRTAGLGVPLVVVRHTKCPQPFTQELQTFAATVILRPDSTTGCDHLEFYDPLRESIAEVGGCSVPIARDLTAPFAYANDDEDRQWLDNFLRPGATAASDGLFMIEPYQPGKIPLVFVHGLLSDPATWADLTNELRAVPELSDRYQWWAFQYATGEPFLASAADLRRQLAQIRQTYDPFCSDPTFSQMVLIGHSMGGLVAKLQVTHSGNQLWQAVANYPLSSVQTDPDTRRQLNEAFHFQPSRNVARVIYVGTPHQGSDWARRPVGRLGSALVEPSEDALARHQQLVRDNPGLFRNELRQRFPTSIDLLEPESPLLAATAALPYSSHVTLHSIVGQGQTGWNGEDSDGVVPVASARLVGVASESIVNAKHEALHRSPDAVKSIQCILQKHLRQAALYGGGAQDR